MGHYTATRPDLELSAGRVISAIRSGKLKIRINQTYALKDAAQAHRDLQERKTTGSILLLP
jgi:NADPH2:quinone reductase